MVPATRRASRTGRESFGTQAPWIVVLIDVPRGSGLEAIRGVEPIVCRERISGWSGCVRKD
ncbi:hypothetical protein SSBR45G_59690 [Bradyrhizobium sp. SSBR45G]|nr:hypothetical protein SSBR45G_59690 [Bradyrhizobium sp. SSBR45G]GLH89277.1 hypothetical protein SSBR45R_67380 [Bradyrhizobium sp. SSBR45R]